MIRVLLSLGLVLLLAVGGFLYWRLQPEEHAGYVMDKQLQGERGGSGIVWNAMPVGQAYQSLGKGQTAFRAEISSAPSSDADYLATLFGLTDAAVAQRVVLETGLRDGTLKAADLAGYKPIIEGILALDTPKALIPVEAQVYEAVKAQRDYLEAWRQSGDPGYYNPADPAVQAIHDKLLAAYDSLVKLYSAEEMQNKRAFFDHLAALDFL